MKGAQEPMRIVVTGTSSGLGLEIAQHFSERGDHVLGISRGLPPQGALFRTFPADLRDPAAVPSVAAAALDLLGGADALINNAAIIGPVGPTTEVNLKEWDELLKVNLLSPIALCQAFCSIFIKQGRGKIVNLSGGGATSSRPCFSAYAASKVALVRVSECLADELKGSGIDVNCIAPGAMQTRMTQDIINSGSLGGKESEKAKSYDNSAMPRTLRLIEMLLSPQSDGISGKLFSAVWDKWEELPAKKEQIGTSDLYTLRRIVPEESKK